MQEIYEIFVSYGTYLLAGYLGVSMALDLMAKKVSLTLTGLFFVTGFMGQLAGLFVGALGNVRSGQSSAMAVTELLLGLLPGIFLLAVSLVTGDKLGKGDAMVFLVCGIYLGLYQTILLLMFSLFVTGVCGCFCILLRKASYQSALPWMPFVFAGFLFMQLTGAFQG